MFLINMFSAKLDLKHVIKSVIGSCGTAINGGHLGFGRFLGFDSCLVLLVILHLYLGG